MKNTPKNHVVTAKPFVKWAGGKRRLVEALQTHAPENYNRYFEPFIGGGALFFALKPHLAVISDLNAELINCYQMIREHVDDLVEALKVHVNEPEYFYEIRGKQPSELDEIARASRFIFLNKTCFNGLYRESSKGQFNTPFGRYKNPKILDETNLRNVRQVLIESAVDIRHASYDDVVSEACEGDFVYFDPPYIPLTPTANFASYTKNGFGLKEQERLAAIYTQLAERGVFVMLSNSDTETVRDLYSRFHIHRIHSTRLISCKPQGRSVPVGEVLVTSY